MDGAYIQHIEMARSLMMPNKSIHVLETFGLQISSGVLGPLVYLQIVHIKPVPFVWCYRFTLRSYYVSDNLEIIYPAQV